MYENIPEELKKVKQWVCWAGDKLPKNPRTGGNAQSNNPDTWSDFNTACDAVSKYGFSGIGFMFAPPYFGVDLDKCLDNTDFIDEFVDSLQSYNEISKSGKGIHIICKGVLPIGNKRRGNVEMYSERRYFIVTGNLYNSRYAQIVDCTEPIKVLHSKYLGDTTPKVAPKQCEPLNMTDSEIIDKIRESKNGTLFQLLYSGDWQGLPYDSQSSADMALCNILAFWTARNTAQMDRIFRASGLYRNKWNEKRGQLTYGEMTIEKACANCSEVYQPITHHRDDGDISLAMGMFGGDKPTPQTIYDMTDTGNAERFKDKYIGQVRYSFINKRWYFWTGHVWVIDNTGEIKKLADEVIKDMRREAFAERDEEMQETKLKWVTRTASSKGKEAMIKETQHLLGIPVLPDEMDAYTDYLNCQNGIINLRNGELMPHDSSFLMSRISYAEYDNTSGKQPELWLKFLDDVTGGDKDLQRYLQKCVGYSLSGSVREQCLFFLYGMGNNGKSTFLDTISTLMGGFAANVQPETIMLKRNGDGGANSDIARLKGTRFATCEEPTEGVRLNEGLVKQFTGGGKITARFLYGDEFEYSPEFKFWIATNHKPVIRGTDIGIWRRIRLIPFEVNIPPEKVDKTLKYKLRKEFPQILKWAVDGCIMWQREGLELPECVAKATAAYKSEMDMLATFCDACVEIDYTSNGVAATDLFTVYTGWAEKNNEYTMSSRKFFLEIAKKLPEKIRRGSGIYYTKIKLTDYATKFLSPHKQYQFSDFN